MAFFKAKPKISVVVVAYNREDYIRECMDSIISQPIDLEVICIDDCSTDKTFEILREYEAKHPNVRAYQNEKNSGTVVTRYNGLMQCRGKYALLVDADDYVLQNALPALYEEASLYGADILEFSVKTDGPEALQNAYKKGNEAFLSDLFESYGEGKFANTLFNKLVSKKVYSKALLLMSPEIRQPNFSDVLYFMFHFLSHANNVYSTETFGYFYYNYRGMTSNLPRHKVLKEFCDFILTKRELERVYGKSEALSKKWNIVCNQAIVTFLDIPEEEREEYRPMLDKLMSKKNQDHLISEIIRYRKEHNL